MNVTCPECQSVFRVDPAKVPATGIRARCSVCGGIIVIAAGTLAASVAPNGRATSSGERPAVPQAQSHARTPAQAQPTPAAPSMPFASTATHTAAHTATHAGAMANAAAVSAPAVSKTPTAGTPAGTPSARKSINPFLNADPGQRARRLARALVSDLVAYHPQNREEGLRNGTLRQLFRDEIKKSYEEFAEQVGRETAESSTHFQDALNEVLAAGRKLF